MAIDINTLSPRPLLYSAYSVEFGLGEYQAPELVFINSESRGHVMTGSGITRTTGIKSAKFLLGHFFFRFFKCFIISGSHLSLRLATLHIKTSSYPLRTFKMTYTVVMLVYRNPQMTPDKFRDHYENKHIPFMKKLLGVSFPLSHSRRYILRSDADGKHAATIVAGTQADFEFDCVSELKFESEADFQSMSALLSSAENSAAVGEDCMAFMDPGKTKMVVIGEVNITSS